MPRLSCGMKCLQLKMARNIICIRREKRKERRINSLLWAGLSDRFNPSRVPTSGILTG